MNVIRGLDRIALVIAIIAILPGFFLGGFITDEVLTTSVTIMEEQNTDLYGQMESSFSTKYQHPPDWQCVMGAIVSAPLSFLVVLYSLRGTTRLVLWIVKGFRDEKNGEPDKHMGNEANNQDCVSNETQKLDRERAGLLN